MSLSINITSASGDVYRLGPDEEFAGWVPEDITFGTVIPGGYKECSFNIRRRVDEDVPLRLLDEVVIVDEHGEHVYEGRIQQLPREGGQEYLLGVKCLGLSSHLTDDTSFREIYIDRSLAGWAATMSTQRRIDLLDASPAWVIFDATTTHDTQIPAILTTVSNGVNRRVCEAIHLGDAGIGIGVIYYEFAKTSGVVLPDPNWFWAVYGVDNDRLEGAVGTGNLAAASGSGYVALPGLPEAKRACVLQLSYAGGGGGEGIQYEVQWRNVARYGQHGLTRHQIDGADPGGFYIDDILANALSRAAPKLNFTTGVDGSIERPSLIVDQAAYGEAGPVEQVVLDLNKYVLWDWGVYNDRTFFFRPPDPNRLTWDARLDQGIHLALEGDDAENAINGVIVKYSMLDGTRKIAGPPVETYSFDVESDLLRDPNPDNVVNSHGYPAKYGVLDITFPLARDEYATTIGAAYLAQSLMPARSGSIDLFGEIEHPAKGMRPVREVRAGDWIRLSQHPADVPRKIVQTSYSHNDLKNTVTVGNAINRVDAMLDFLGVKTSVAVGA